MHFSLLRWPTLICHYYMPLFKILVIVARRLDYAKHLMFRRTENYNPFGQLEGLLWLLIRKKGDFLQLSGSGN